MNLQEGMVVADKFRLARMIGRGGMGSVWKAHHMGLDVPCAVKFIEGELAKQAEAQARFEREAKAAAALRNPHVVQIYDYGVWQGTPYIAMELLEGQDLGKVLAGAPGGRLPPSEINRVVQQVCKALSKAHQAGIVHRDLKPDNIFILNDDDGPGTVKILDFGVAKQTSHTIDGSNTKTGAMLGTPYYMSPEQAQGIKSVDGRSDLWSLAVIVFQCITGRLPFESEALGDLLVKIIVSPIPVPSSMCPDVPLGFDAWWLRVADRNVDNRPQTAKAFSESLMLALGQSSVTDVNFDRNKLLKLGGGTAVMNNAGVASNVPNTPVPGQRTGALLPNTPNPYVQHQTPPTPQPQQGHAATGATFSGVEPPARVPKTGVPLGVFAGIGAIAVIGIGLVAFLTASKKHPPTDRAPSASVAARGPAADSVAPKHADPPPSVAASTAPVAAAGPSAGASASAAVPPPVAAAAPAGAPRVPARVTSGAKPPSVAAAPAIASVGAATKPATSSPAAKPAAPVLGF